MKEIFWKRDWQKLAQRSKERHYSVNMNYNVIKPAVFVDAGQGKWKLKEKGLLDLGKGESVTIR